MLDILNLNFVHFDRLTFHRWLNFRDFSVCLYILLKGYHFFPLWIFKVSCEFLSLVVFDFWDSCCRHSSIFVCWLVIKLSFVSGRFWHDEMNGISTE